MSYLKKILGGEAAEKLPEEYEGIKIVQRPIEEFGKKGKEKGGGIGMHKLDEKKELEPGNHAFHQLVDDAISKGFKTLYIYNQGTKHKKPDLYVIPSATAEAQYIEE